MLSLRCLLDIQMEMLSLLLDIQVWSSVEQSGWAFKYRIINIQITSIFL